MFNINLKSKFVNQIVEKLIKNYVIDALDCDKNDIQVTLNEFSLNDTVNYDDEFCTVKLDLNCKLKKKLLIDLIK